MKREANLQLPEVRRRMERDARVKHFTVGDQPENGYDETWGAVIRAYLKEGHKADGALKEITVAGILYKILVRTKDTVFYDADGHTLFDVENKRLDREYEQLMDAPKETETEGARQEMADTPKTMAVDKAGDRVSDGKEHIAEEVSVKQAAKEKLEKELEGARDKSFAGPVIGYLLGRCAEDEGLSQDVVQEHKTWEKCLDHIYEKAREQAVDNRAAVRDSVVYEWAEDYYHKDDKAEEAEKARKEAERKKRQKKEAAEKAAKANNKPSKTAAGPKKKADAPKEQPRPKKNNKDMEGQLDMFSMMGV